MPATRPARSVLAEHGARDPLPINPGDEVFVTLPGVRADGVEGCELRTPSGRPLTVTHRLRDAGCGERDAVALIEPRAAGLWSYTWTLDGETVEGTFQVGPIPRRRRGKGRR